MSNKALEDLEVNVEALKSINGYALSAGQVILGHLEEPYVVIDAPPSSAGVGHSVPVKKQHGRRTLDRYVIQGSGTYYLYEEYIAHKKALYLKSKANKPNGEEMDNGGNNSDDSNKLSGNPSGDSGLAVNTGSDLNAIIMATVPTQVESVGTAGNDNPSSASNLGTTVPDTNAQPIAKDSLVQKLLNKTSTE
jgi:hypothetical protein